MFTSGLRGGERPRSIAAPRPAGTSPATTCDAHFTAARILSPGAGAGGTAEPAGPEDCRARRPAPDRRRAPRSGMFGSLLLRLSDETQVRLHRLEAGGVRLLGLVVGDGGDDDDVLPLLPVHRRRHLVLRRELARIEESQHLVEVAAGRHRVRQHGLDLLVRTYDAHRA